MTLHAGTASGVAELSAFSGGAQSSTPVRIAIGAAAATGVAVTASPGTVPAGGGTVTLTAKPTDANGNTLPGVPVSFSADAGTLGARTVVSNSLGEARTTLTTDRNTAVTASVGEYTLDGHRARQLGADSGDRVNRSAADGRRTGVVHCHRRRRQQPD